VVDLSVVPLGEVGALGLPGNPQGNQQEPIYRASS